MKFKTLTIATLSMAILLACSISGFAQEAGNLGVEVGQLAPEFSLQNNKGEWVSLSSFRGKKVYLFSWATWCRCREQLPYLQKFYEKNKSDKFEVIAVASDSEGFKWVQKYLDDAGATFTALVDPEHELATKYNFLATENGFLIDEGGTIRMSIIGYDIRNDEQRAILEKAMAQDYNVTVGNDGKKVDIEKEITAIEEGLKKKPKAFSKWLELAELYRRKGSYEKAEEALRAAVDLKKKDAEARFKLGVVLYQKGSVEEAVKEWEKAYKYESTNYIYMRTLEAHKTPEKFYSEMMKD